MIRPTDWALIGLSLPAMRSAARFGTPAAPASLPLRESTELFPGWAANPLQSLRLGLGCSLRLGHTGKLIGQFREACPDVELTLADVDEVRAGESLRSEGMDAAILLAGEAPSGLRSADLWREPLTAVLPIEHPLATADAIDSAALRKEILLMAGDDRGDTSLQRTIVRALGGLPAAILRYQVERDTLFDLVALNFGITLAVGPAANALHPGVRFRPIASPMAEAAYGLFWKPGNRNPALHAFARAARDFSRRCDVGA
jgi:DNA-binding transcriptional LysR family regulator